MPCCWPPTATASTSSSPPASATAASSAAPHAAGSTSVPSGWAARPSRTVAPVSESRTRTLQDWVEESTPATSATSGPHTVEVLQRQLVEPLEAHPAAAGLLGVEGLRAQVGEALALRERRLRELVDAGVGQRLLHLRVGAEGAHLLAQDQVVAHARLGGDPDTVDVLGARWLVVEVARAVVAAVLDDVDGPERASGVAGAEAQVLVVARAGLAVEVDVEELARPQGLREAVRVVQRGHLLVPDLGVHADQLGVLQLVDEGERVPDGRQQDVAARLVRLRLDGEPEVVALLEHVVTQHV